MNETVYTFAMGEGTHYLTMHDGAALFPDPAGTVRTTNPAYAAQLRALGGTEIQTAPAEDQTGVPEPERASPAAAALEIEAEPAPLDADAAEEDPPTGGRGRARGR